MLLSIFAAIRIRPVQREERSASNKTLPTGNKVLWSYGIPWMSRWGKFSYFTK